MYYELGIVKLYLEVESGDDTRDAILNELGASADQEMDNFLATISGGDDISDNLILIKEDIRDAVNFKVAYRYFLVIKDFESAEKWSKEVDKLKKSITDRIARDKDTYTLIVKGF